MMMSDFLARCEWLAANLKTYSQETCDRFLTHAETCEDCDLFVYDVKNQRLIHEIHPFAFVYTGAHPCKAGVAILENS